MSAKITENSTVTLIVVAAIVGGVWTTASAWSSMGAKVERAESIQSDVIYLKKAVLILATKMGVKPEEMPKDNQ